MARRPARRNVPGHRGATCTPRARGQSAHRALAQHHVWASLCVPRAELRQDRCRRRTHVIELHRVHPPCRRGAGRFRSADGDGVARRAEAAGQVERRRRRRRTSSGRRRGRRAARRSKSNISPSARPSVGSRRRWSDPTAGSPGTTSTAGLSQHSAAGWAFQIVAGHLLVGVQPGERRGRRRRPARRRRRARGRPSTQPVRTHQMSPTSGSTPWAASMAPDVVGRDRAAARAGRSRERGSASQPATSISTPRPAMPCSAQCSMPSPLGPSVGSCVRPPQ